MCSLNFKGVIILETRQFYRSIKTQIYVIRMENVGYNSNLFCDRIFPLKTY